MKYLISKRNFALLVAGMTAAERTWFEQTFECYPDEFGVQWRVDQDRIAAEFARLLAADRPPRLLRTRAPVWNAGRRNGKTFRYGSVDDLLFLDLKDFRPEDPPGPRWPPGWEVPTGRAGGVRYELDGPAPACPDLLSPPWQQIADGCWIAPADTPPPADAQPSPWLAVDDLVDEIVADAAPAFDRYFLNDEVTEDPRELVAGWSRRLAAAGLPPPRRHLRAGDEAIAAFKEAYAPRRGWAKDVAGSAAALAHLADIPIVPDPDLQPHEWRLVDPETGEVLYHGTVRPHHTIEELQQVVIDCVDELAARSGVPRDLLFPHYLL